MAFNAIPVEYRLNSCHIYASDILNHIVFTENLVRTQNSDLRYPNLFENILNSELHKSGVLNVRMTSLYDINITLKWSHSFNRTLFLQWLLLLLLLKIIVTFCNELYQGVLNFFLCVYIKSTINNNKSLLFTVHSDKL